MDGLNNIDVRVVLSVSAVTRRSSERFETSNARVSLLWMMDV